MWIASLAHLFFALTLIALGILGLVQGDFTPTWGGVPEAWPAPVVLAYLCAFVSLLTGVGLLWQRRAVVAARVLLTYLLLWLLLFRVPYLFIAPGETASWWACGDTAVMVAAAWTLYTSFAGDRRGGRFGFTAADTGRRTRECSTAWP
jgi:hypothetical protein